ncbi:MAG: DUF177 domain-containing protein [Thermodesulfobacteriota bacterium]
MLQPTPVPVAHLPPEGQKYSLSFPQEDVGAALAEAGWEEVGAAAALTAEIRVLPAGSEVFVLGRLETRVAYRCVRCLGVFPAPVTAEVHAAFTREGAPEPGEWELRREDLDVQRIPGGTLDLSEVVAEQFFLELEPHPVCRPECRGLCPQCGADRNRTACRCAQAAQPSPFQALEAWGKARRS